jgi:hypothetical protein
MNKLILAAVLFGASPAFAQLLTWPQWTATGNTYKQVPPAAWVIKCLGSNAYCVPEIDPATGAIPVEPIMPYDTDIGNAGPDTLRVVIASDQPSIPVVTGSLGYADSARNVYSVTPVTTGAWVQLIASTADTINSLAVFDSSGQTLELGVGAAASETRILLIPPGGIDGQTPIGIPAGTRLSVRAVSATASVGELTLTGLGL